LVFTNYNSKSCTFGKLSSAKIEQVSTASKTAIVAVAESIREAKTNVVGVLISDEVI